MIIILNVAKTIGSGSSCPLTRKQESVRRTEPLRQASSEDELSDVTLVGKDCHFVGHLHCGKIVQNVRTGKKLLDVTLARGDGQGPSHQTIKHHEAHSQLVFSPT